MKIAQREPAPVHATLRLELTLRAMAFVDADTSPQSYRRLRGEPGGQIMAIGDTLTPISHAPASSRLVS